MKVHLIDLADTWSLKYRATVKYHRMGLPFVVSHFGQLVHRVRAICDHTDTGQSSVDLWCGHGFSLSRAELYEAPPSGRLLCEACERKAQAAGELTADELAGHHVCTGRLKAVRSCCLNEGN